MPVEFVHPYVRSAICFSQTAADSLWFFLHMFQAQYWFPMPERQYLLRFLFPS